MGTFLRAHCPACSFTAGFVKFGHGMLRHVPMLPAWDALTESMIAVEPGDPRPLKYYHVQAGYNDPFHGNGIQSMDIWLNRDGNWCPGCGEHTMRFDEAGEWD